MNVSGEKSAFSSMTANVTAAQMKLGATMRNTVSSETQYFATSPIIHLSRSCITIRVSYSLIWKVLFFPQPWGVSAIRCCFSITSVFSSSVLDHVKQRPAEFHSLSNWSSISVLLIVTSSHSCNSAQLCIQMVVPGGWSCSQVVLLF